jgi:hypothetical protein
VALVFCAGIVSAVSFTSTSSRRDEVFAPNKVLDVFVEHYNGHRPHRALALTPPDPARPPMLPATECSEARVQRRDRLGGVVHEYVLAA